MTENEKEMMNSIFAKIAELDYIKPDEIPNIALYMDQVTTFMEDNLASTKRHDDDKILTKTMINNYAKNKLLPPPEKKRYSREHLLMLIFIYYFKNILSIQKDVAFDPAAFYQIIHAVDGFEQCGFSTSGRPDKRCDLMFFDFQIDIFQCLEIAVV